MFCRVNMSIQLLPGCHPAHFHVENSSLDDAVFSIKIFYLHHPNPSFMKLNPSDRKDHLRRLNDIEREQLLQQLKQTLDWIDQYETREPILRSYEDNALYKKKSRESTRLSRQLSQHALISLQQLAYLLTDTMEVIEIAMDIDRSDNEKYYVYRELRKNYVKFMK